MSHSFFEPMSLQLLHVSLTWKKGRVVHMMDMHVCVVHLQVAIEFWDYQSFSVQTTAFFLRLWV